MDEAVTKTILVTITIILIVARLASVVLASIKQIRDDKKHEQLLKSKRVNQRT